MAYERGNVKLSAFDARLFHAIAVLKTNLKLLHRMRI